MTGTLTGRAARFRRGVREVAHDAWAWLQPNGAWGEANAGLVAGDGEALVIDTLFDERLAREMLAGFDPLLAGRPIRRAFITHSDGDHWWGNHALPADTEILTSEPSQRAIEEEASPGEIARMRRLASLAAWLPGPASRLGYAAEMLAPFDHAGVTPRPPTRTFAGEETLDVGGREVRLIEVGPAHTPGDAIAHVPDAGVAFAADVLFAGSTPVMWVGPLENWLAALDTLLGLDAGVYVPGHGPPGGREVVEEMRDYMGWVGEAVREHHGAGRSPVDATRAMLRSPEFARWRDWECPERLLITVTTVHRALDGKGPVGSSPVVRTKLFAQIGGLARELDRG